MHTPDGKSRWVVNLTIHDLDTKSQNSGPCVIRWARGSHKGATSRLAPDSNGIVHFDHTTVIPCTIVKKMRDISPKEIVFEVKQGEPRKSRIIGELKMNLTPFVGQAPVVSQTFTMRGVGSQAPVLRLSIAIGSRTRKISDMDIATLPNDLDQIHSAVATRARRNTVNQMCNNLPISTLSADAVNPPDFAKNILAEMLIRSPVKKPAPPKLTFSDHLKKFCNSSWFPTYTQNEAFQGFDSVLFAFLYHYKLFSVEDGPTDREYDAQLAEWIKMIHDSYILTFLDENQKLFALFGFYLLLSNPPVPDTDKIRTRKMVRLISQDLIPRLEAYIDEIVVMFDSCLGDIFDKRFDVDGDARRLTRAVCRVRDESDAPSILVEHVINALIERLDVELVNRMINYDAELDFMTSIHWNTFCSRMESGALEIKFSKFREAVAVIQMTAVIDERPEMAEKLCPSLPADIVLSILKKRVTDEDLRKLPDLGKFASFYSINLDAPHKPLKMDCRRICGPSGSVVDTSLWKDVCICSRLFKEFPWLSDYFTQN